ncbi:MAG: hypothetical protein IJW82_05490 [Clostridia bacterium]|nr:hypothetical protein [Clostridia bacterium]
MKFEIVFNENEPQKALDVYHSIKVIYDDIHLFSKNGGGDGILCIENTYLEVDFDIESKRVCGISGYIGKKNKLKTEPLFEPLNYQSGILYIKSKEPCTQGVGYSYKMPNKICYDPKNKILSIGITNKDFIVYKILDNVFVYTKDNNLLGIIISDI